ncbi:MAG: FAD-dependent oxidoreductase [Flexilinea sp.]
MAVGFTPNSQTLGLENIGVKTDRRGFIETDDWMQTCVPGVLGDWGSAGKALLAHAASKQGIICAESIADREPDPIDYKMMPSAVYCIPRGWLRLQRKRTERDEDRL